MTEILGRRTFSQWMKIIQMKRPFFYLKSKNLFIFLPTPKELKIIFNTYR
jgi:hypothetical protein